MDTTPENFDWVTARATCTIEKVFGNLAFEVEQDINIRNGFIPDAQKKSGDFAGFQIEPKSESVFLVHRNGAGIHTTLRFEHSDTAIWVTNAKGERILEGKLTLNDAGECRILVGKNEIAHWQFRRRALQSLFFDF